jgi:hypothetical protein
MRSDRKLQLVVTVLSLALQAITAPTEAISLPRAYYTCDMMSGKWTDIKEGNAFICPKNQKAQQPSGGLHCESECTFLRTKSSGQKEKETIRSPSGLDRAFTFIKPGDKIKLIKIK